MSSRSGRVFVFGSANQDLVFQVAELPSAGETILSTFARHGLGGKGANQAVAASAAGAEVVFVGAVGGDAAAGQIVENLGRRGVDTSWIEHREGQSTGLAAVVVDAHGRNQIVVAAGANAELSVGTIASAMERVRHGDIVVVQCEIPADRVEAIVTSAASRSAFVVVNLAPPTEISKEILKLAGLIVVNESEARAVVGEPHVDAETLADLAARVTRTACVVTLGSHGSRYCSPGSDQVRIDAESASTIVDTTGAGDTYVGTLAAHLAEGHDIQRAMAAASHAAALSVTHPGAQQSLDALPQPTSV